MINIKTIQEMIKKEFGVNLNDIYGHYRTSNGVVYVKEYDNGFHVSLIKSSRKYNAELNVTGYSVTNEHDLKTLIRKFKRLRKSF